MVWCPRITRAQSEGTKFAADKTGMVSPYSQCAYAASTHHVFHMDELVRYIRFRDVLAEEMRRSQGYTLRELSGLAGHEPEPRGMTPSSPRTE